MNFWFQSDFIIDMDWLFEWESMDPDQLVSTASGWSGSTLFSKESIVFQKVIMPNMVVHSN